MNVAIVEDEQAHSDLLSRYILAWAGKRGRKVHIFLYENAEVFLFSWEDGMPDVVFADIQMPGMNGMEMVRKLRKQDSELPVIFTSGLVEYLQEGYEVQALHYLIKPLSEEKVFDCMDRVCSREKSQRLFTFKTEEGMARLDLREVDYCEADGHYTRFVMADGTEIRAMTSISELERELPERIFVKCHRCYLCNLERVKRIERDTVIFDDGKSVAVSRRLYWEFNRKFIELYRGSL